MEGGTPGQDSQLRTDSDRHTHTGVFCLNTFVNTNGISLIIILFYPTGIGALIAFMVPLIVSGSYLTFNDIFP